MSSKGILLEDLQEQHRELAEVIGIENLIKLSSYLGGTQIYIPCREHIIKAAKYQAIKREFDGNNIKQLSKKYGVSESTVYRIIRQQK